MVAFNRISVDPQICHGKPCIRGHRVMVYQILDLLEAGKTFDQIIQAYFPTITKKDIRACLEYANHLVKNEEIHFINESKSS